MPPSVKFTKQEIINAALEVVRQSGVEALNARAIARQLGCSTQPLYRELQSMEALRDEVRQEAARCYASYLTQRAKESTIPYKGAGMAFLRFAYDEKELFKLLFMRVRNAEEQHLDDSDPSLPYLLTLSMSQYGFTQEQALQFHLHISVYTHGLGVMLATGYIDYNEAWLSEALSLEFQALHEYYASHGETH